MAGRGAASRQKLRIAVCAAAGLVMLALCPQAGAQTGDDLLRAIRPWLKRQLLGGEEPAVSSEGAAAQELEDGRQDDAPADAPPETSGETEFEGGSAAAQDRAADPEAPEDGMAGGAGEPVEPEEVARQQPGGSEGLEEPAEERPLPLRFAVLADRGAAATLAAVGPIADDIGALVDRPVELLPMSSYAAMIDAQVERRIDGGFYSASAFALADSRCHCLEPIVAPRASDGTTAYHAVVVARANSGIASAFDLVGKTVAVGAADSIGARRMQLAGLVASGIDPTAFGGVIETSSANQAVLLVRDGQADAAFAWSSLSGAAERGYSRGTLTQLVANGEITMDDFAIVWRSSPITHGPFAVLRTLSDEEQDKIGAFLVTLEATRPEAYDKLNPFYGGGYAPVDSQDYGALETLMAQNLDSLRLPRAAAEVLPRSEDEAPPAE